MPSIQPSHRLYLYQLLAREVGFGRQVGLARVGEVLANDGLVPADLGCADVRALCDALDGMVRVTAFKKGQVFATLLSVEEYDRALMRLEAGKDAAGERGAAGAKSFKRKKGARDLRPVRPRHVPTAAERAAAEAAAAATAAAATAAAATAAATTAAAAEPEPEDVEAAPAPDVVPEVGSADALEELLPADEPQAEAPIGATGTVAGEGAGAERAPEPEAVVAPEAMPVFALDTTPEPVPGPEPAAAAEPTATAGPEPLPAPEPPAHEPSIRLQITYVPEPEPELEPDERPEASAEPEPKPETMPAPAPAPHPRTRRGLPQDFRAEVLVPNDMLLSLYEVLPPDADPLAVLDEDLRVARSTGVAEGDRAQASFPLRYLRASGEPVRVVLRRVARPAPGATSAKRWVVAAVEADAPESVSLAGLGEAPRGAWAAFAQAPARRRPAGPMAPCDLGPVTTPDPERALAQTVGLGPWDELLPRLAALLPPEDWGPDLHVLRECVAMGFCRVVAQGALATSADGACAAFDLGLASATGEPVRALLLATGTDIPWALDDLVAAAGPVGPAALDPEPPRYLRALAEAAFDPALPAPPLAARAALERDPRLAAPAYDALHDRVVLLVPDAPAPAEATAAVTLVPGPDGYAPGPAIGLEAARTCARVVSATLPAWLRAR